MYKRWTQADKDYREMQAWAVGVIAAPTLLAASPAEVGLALQMKATFNVGAFSVDAGVQSLTNKIEGKDMMANYNFTSGALALFTGVPEGATLSNIIGVNILNSTISSTVNLSAGSVFGPDPVLGFHPGSPLSVRRLEPAQGIFHSWLRLDRQVIYLPRRLISAAVELMG